eukprot:15471243-Alexandrium_andersonii.AAC.1
MPCHKTQSELHGPTQHWLHASTQSMPAYGNIRYQSSQRRWFPEAVVSLSSAHACVVQFCS